MAKKDNLPLMVDINDEKYDIVIVGAGPAGLSLAASLARTSLKVLVVEQQCHERIVDPQPDGRDIALTHLSKKILSKLGVWQRLLVEDISTIHQAKVMDGNSPYALNFTTESVRLGNRASCLGYLVPNYRIRQAVYEQVTTLSNVDIATGVSNIYATTDNAKAKVQLSDGTTRTCKLLIGADSRFSKLRQQMGIAADMEDFGRTVIVCRAKHEISNAQIAYEHFRYGGTVAVLPVSTHLSSIVLTLPTNEANAMMRLAPSSFNTTIISKLDRRLGQMELVGERYAYPLVAVLSRKFYAKRFALIGDAAVGMHPVTAHGFNLGLRGQDKIADLVKTAMVKGDDIASDELLIQYNEAHRRQCVPLYYATKFVVRTFTNDEWLPKIARQAILRASDKLPPIKKLITDRLAELHD